MCVCVIFNFGTSRTMFSQKGGICNGFEFVNNTSSSTTSVMYCISLDFRPSVMEVFSNAVGALHPPLSVGWNWLKLERTGLIEL